MSIRQLARIVAVVCGVVFVSLARPALGVPAPGPTGGFRNSPVGFLGCVASAGAGHTYCFESHIDAKTGTAEVVTLAADGSGNTSTSTVIVGGGALSVVGTDVVLAVTVPGIGDVNLDAHSYAVAGMAGNDATCPLYPIVYALAAQTPVIYNAGSVTGTVAGDTVEATNRCGAYFVGPTSGLWSLPLGGM